VVKEREGEIEECEIQSFPGSYFTNLFRDLEPALAGVAVDDPSFFFFPNKPPNNPFFFFLSPLSGVAGGFDELLVVDTLVFTLLGASIIDG